MRQLRYVSRPEFLHVHGPPSALGLAWWSRWALVVMVHPGRGLRRHYRVRGWVRWEVWSRCDGRNPLIDHDSGRRGRRRGWSWLDLDVGWRWKAVWVKHGLWRLRWELGQSVVAWPRWMRRGRDLLLLHGRPRFPQAQQSVDSAGHFEICIHLGLSSRLGSVGSLDGLGSDARLQFDQVMMTSRDSVVGGGGGSCHGLCLSLSLRKVWRICPDHRLYSAMFAENHRRRPSRTSGGPGCGRGWLLLLLR